ncbi:MAG: T9SS C-terminal target domain-containing protein [Calditrichaeota bacterium]|nr:MAG: T9SS C-terminal target domain-containing protein [Calditrichota bacterium]MBL1205421.1 T9SS C-terminal target domain-containing protein [Calditrichota bacterium]NOG45250.1 T9SS type A sorting domain-containing protein [Calditrichota bacterium]
MRKLTALFVSLFLSSMFMLQAQTMDFKTGYQFPTVDQDSVLSGLASIRGMDLHDDPLGEGVAGFAVTNYYENGFIHVFKNAGDDAMELVWTSPDFDSLGGASHPRFVKWGDLDNDGIIELIAPFDGNGIAIFEWDGVAGSWNFGDAPAKTISSPLYSVYPDSANGYNNVEFMDVADVDDDGQNELMFANNSSGSGFDRYYVFSINGTYSTGNPGFSVVKREGHWPRNEVYANYGGGTPYAVVAADLDGNGVKDMVFHNWNYGHHTPVRSTGADTYELADTTGGNNYVYGDPTDDMVSLGGGRAIDIDEDGKEEVYFPMYSANGMVLMAHYDDGNLAHVDTTNAFMLDVVPENDDRYDFFGRPGVGDWDSDGKPNLYYAARHGAYVRTSEFMGGEKTDPNNWEHSILYTGDELDSKIYSSITTTDSAGHIVSDTVLQANSEGTIAMKLFGNYTDFDGDKFEDIIIPTQAWGDSIDIFNYTWVRDTAWTVYDTMYAGTDSMEIDTVDFTHSVYDTVETKIVEPNRISIRMIESTQINSIESKEMTVILPSDYKLRQNYPNPFNPETNIEFFLPIKKKISLTIYNSVGQKVKTLINNEAYNKGTHTMQWNGTNNAGVKVATGMYIYELKYGNFKKNKRMMLIK